MQKKKDFNGYTKQEKRSKGYNSFQYLKKILNVGNIMNIWNSIEWIVILEYIKNATKRSRQHAGKTYLEYAQRRVCFINEQVPFPTPI